MIGELGFFDQAPRTVTISARRDSVLLEIDQTALEQLSPTAHREAETAKAHRG